MSQTPYSQTELNASNAPSSPRKISPQAKKFLGSNSKALWILGVVSIFAGVLLSVMSKQTQAQYQLLLKKGLTVNAEITKVALKVETTTTQKKKKGKTKTKTKVDWSYDVAYQYKHLGKEYLGFFTTETRNYRTTPSTPLVWLQKGAWIPVRYLPSEPSTHWTLKTFHENKDAGEYANTILVGGVVFGIFLIVFGIFSGKKTVRLYEEGQVTVGKISSFYQKEGEKKESQPWVLDWVIDVDGKSYKGSVSQNKLAAFDFMEEHLDQGELLVVFDPKNPKNNLVYVP